jgi:hypothetical protein
MTRCVKSVRDFTKIIELNDQLRVTFKGGRVQMTPAVWALNTQLRHRALAGLSSYKTFADGTEHDRGVMILDDHSFEWRIEYRGKDGTGFSPDPADPEKTLRVLTLYAASDVQVCVPTICVTGIVVELADEKLSHQHTGELGTLHPLPASRQRVPAKFAIMRMIWNFLT